jgi:TPR repeat protein
VERDAGRAAAAYYAAALGGDGQGQINLAFVLANGIGIEQNLIDAYAWVLIARVGDDLQAADDAREYARRLHALMSIYQRKAGLERAGILRTAQDERATGSVRRLAPMPTDDMGVPTAAAQRYLRQYDYLDSAVDGVNGPVTAGAIRDFQQRHGLAATGIANARLIAVMAATLPMPWDPPTAAAPTDHRP